MRIGGIVLAGGRSTRMGTSKAWLPMAGEPMLVRIVRVLATVASPVVVVSAEGQALPPLPPDVRVVCDPEPAGGPLVGLVAGLTAQTTTSDACFVLACDLPALSPTYFDWLRNHLGDAEACVPVLDGVRQPLAALYRVNILPEVARRLTAGRRSVHGLSDALRMTGPDAEAFRAELQNINTPAEYARLLANSG